MNRILSLILLVVMLGATAVSSSADGCYRWFIKRNKGAAPGFPAEADNVSSLDGYYIDVNAAGRGEKVIYLTFDAGYENGNVERILDTLKEEGVQGAFFLLDNIILKNTELVKRMAEEGHLVCNHTRNHKNLSSASAEEIKENLESLERIYKEKTGREMDKYFRFPAGEYSLEAMKAIKEMGYKTVFWSFAYADWDNHRQPDSEMAMKLILENTHPGAVILLHPTSNTNADILPRLIAEWRKMGYTFGTLDQLTV